MPKEIVTLQLGHTANFVGTHFWNIQNSYFNFENEGGEELDHDVLYRAGRNVYGDDTYTPRLLILDLKGSLKTLKRVSPLYEAGAEGDDNTVSTWSGRVEKHVQEPYKKNDFLKSLDEETTTSEEPVSFSSHLEQSVTVWSDFNNLFYHPKTVVELPHFLHDDDQNPFSAFTQGLDVMGDPDFRDDILEERLRFFVEECDSLQGFNLMADAVDGFAGVTASLLEYISDEFPKKSAMTFGIHKPSSKEDTNKSHTVAAINSALLMDAAAKNSSLYVPLYAPTTASCPSGAWSKYLRHLSSPYQWSAHLAASIETALLPVRLKTSPPQLESLTQLISGGSSRTVAALASGLPFPLHQDAPFSKAFTVEKGRIPWMLDLTLRVPYDQLGEEYGQCCVVRGVSELSRRQSENQRLPTKSEVQEALASFLESSSSTRGQCYAIEKPMPIGESFPQIFSSQIDENGLINNTRSATSKSPTTRVAMLTRLKMSPHLKDIFVNASSIFKKVNVPISVLYEKGDHGLNREDWMAVKESLQELADSYED
ncbi:hypothetical protein PhCBS80983_g00080 [Powellomyces hirtus]|uniref:Uncharacterized protein n=1 Tax=Powellomyces hirtus TaxID=109895 RepID=A0A507EFB7_9FUNG|nr:hypothetical protein PhCBS80983_g00080 [Powellomyces hirtus]